jgi:hypothetical protein
MKISINEGFWKMVHEGADLCKVIDEETKATRCAWEDWAKCCAFKK